MGGALETALWQDLWGQMTGHKLGLWLNGNYSRLEDQQRRVIVGNDGQHQNAAERLVWSPALRHFLWAPNFIIRIF